MYDIGKISSEVGKFADMAHQLVKMDIEIMNYSLKKVASSGEGYSVSAADFSAKQKKILDSAIATKSSQIYKGDNNIDQEIFTPILFHQDVIGIIRAKPQIGDINNSNNIKSYIPIFSQIAEFIGTKIMEDEEELNKQAMVSMLQIVIRSMDEGAIIINNEGNVNTINRSAKKQLGIDRIISNEKITIIATGDTVNNSKEYRVRIGKNVNTVIGDIYDIPTNPYYKQVLLFRDLKNVQSNIYAMTSTINATGIDNIIGDSEKTTILKNEIVKVSESTSTVLITGESGTGKEMVATAIWQNSDRRDKRFVAINCAAIPEALLESELFGYIKGAFTGADPNGRIGKFELANNGVIFLDEIGDMPLYLQSKLLRVIQDKKITRIGSNQVIPLDVRIIAATNKDLWDMIGENKFREDLYYRLNVIPIEIPPLRDRKDDIEVLVYHFMHHYKKMFSKTFVSIDDDVMEILKNYPWYGNVRELENAVEFMVNMMEEGKIGKGALPKNILTYQSSKMETDSRIRKLDDLMKMEIEKAIKFYGDTTEGKQNAANALGIGIATLYRKLQS